MSTPSFVRIAVIGCGHWGKNLVRVLSELGSLVAVYDIDSELSELISLQYNVPIVHIDQIRDHSDIDGVVIAVPASEHASLAKKVLECGKHVFVEKPLSLNIEDAKSLNDLSQKMNKVFMVGHLLQYHPGYIEVKKLILEGTIGKVLYIYSKRLSLGKIGINENVLWDLAPHDISMILGITNELPEWINSQGNALLNPQIEDMINIQMNFKNGIKAEVHVSWLHPFKESSLIIVGESGMIVFDDVQPWEKKVVLYPHKVKLTNNIPQVEKAEGISYPIQVVEPLKEECLHFIQCIKNNSTPRTDGLEGISVVQVLEAAQRSLKDRKSIQMDHVKYSYYKHETVIIDQGCKIGKGTKIWHFSHFMSGVIMGDDCVIGQNVMIGSDVRVGNRCKIENNVSLYKGVSLEDDVFCGPSCVFTNVNNPRAEMNRKDEFVETEVERGVTIGANATIVCGVRLGAYSFIGAGAVIIRDIKPHALIVGNPGRQIGWVSHRGEKLGTDLTCPRDQRRYRITESNNLEEIKEYVCSEVKQSGKSMPMQFINLKAQQKRIRSEIIGAINRVLDHGCYIMGPEICEFEKMISQFSGVKHAIACSSGTDALLIGLMAKHVGPGHAIFVPSLTFAATAEVVSRIGATIIFIDSLANTFNMDPKSLEVGIETAIKHDLTPIGIIPVDLFGQPADYNSIQLIANKHNLWIMCDAAQSFGASYENRRVGNIGDISTTSFFPAKPLGCYGDGGAIFTNDDQLAQIIKSLRNHGVGLHKFDHVRIGINGRLDTIQAAILIEKLQIFPDELLSRQKTADLYNYFLKDLVQIPYVLPETKSSWAQYSILLPKHVNRDKLMENLQNQGIPTVIYYLKPLHMQEAYNHHLRAGENTLPVSEQISDRILSLPMSGYVTDQQAKRVCELLKKHLDS